MSYAILVVEDDKPIQDLVRMVLEDAGHEVFAVGTGADMYRMFSQVHIDLIVLDLGLPDGDALPHIMKIRENSIVPIVILTARHKIDDRLMALGLGANDYLVKPIHPKELVLRIRNILAQGHHHKDPPSLADIVPPQFNAPPKTQNRYRLFYGIIFILSIMGGGIFLFISKTESIAIVESPQDTNGTVLLPTKSIEPIPVDDEQSIEKTANISAVSAQIEEKKEPELYAVESLPEVVRLSKAEILGYGWVLKSKCNQIPDVKWWKYKTHEMTANYVLRKHSGNWAPYIKSLTERLAKLFSVSDRNSSIVFPTGEKLRGRGLMKYIDQFSDRLSVTRCLAAEAKNHDS